MGSSRLVAVTFILALAFASIPPALASTAAGAKSSTAGVTNDLPMDRMFFGYGNTGQGWTGGDQAYSVLLPNGSEAWLFSDTLLGSVVNGTRAPFPYTPMIHNSIVLQTGNSIVSTLYGGTHSAPKSLVSPPEAGSWYWFGPGIVSGGTLQVIMIQMVSTGTGIFDFKWVGTYLALFSLPSVSLQSVSPLESGDGVIWASSLMTYGGYTYVYGTDNMSANTMYVARVNGTSLLGSWQYLTAGGWSSDPLNPIKVAAGIGSSFSVTRFGGGFLLVSMDSDQFFSGKIYAYSAPTPAGPFGHKTLLYATPDAAFYDQYPGYSVFTYSAMVHPELSNGKSLIVSYSANGSGPKAFTDVTVYRPRFLNVTL